MPSREEIVAALTASGPLELSEDVSLGYPMRVYRNAPASLREILISTLNHGDRTFLIYEDETLTYREHFGKVAALAQRLPLVVVSPWRTRYSRLMVPDPAESIRANDHSQRDAAAVFHWVARTATNPGNATRGPGGTTHPTPRRSANHRDVRRHRD